MYVFFWAAETALPAGFLSQCLQWPGLVVAQSGELITWVQSPPCGWQQPMNLYHHCLPPRNSEKPESRAEPDLKPSYSHTECGCPKHVHLSRWEAPSWIQLALFCSVRFLWDPFEGCVCVCTCTRVWGFFCWLTSVTQEDYHTNGVTSHRWRTPRLLQRLGPLPAPHVTHGSLPTHLAS